VFSFLRQHVGRVRRWLENHRNLHGRVERLEAEVVSLRRSLDATSALYERRLDQIIAHLAAAGEEPRSKTGAPRADDRP
jgi:hypothetical protein